MGKRMLASAESREGSGKGGGREDRKEGGWGGVDGNGRGSERGKWGGEQQGLEEGVIGEGDNGEGVNGEGKMARGERGKRFGWGRGEEEARGGEISQMDMMGCLGGHGL